jgi:hypothetical protein
LREDHPPGEQERSHGDHAAHDDILQSLGQAIVPQAVVLENGPSHETPPCRCWRTIVRVDVREPPPHVFEHAPFTHEEYLQFTGQLCTLQCTVSCREPQPLPP